ncbi:3'-5' exonuclease KapD [Bacillus marinisedimentorum]|uniref:3'-5' exonuclease KapD n=1 Tax=Bacillus marinisedimentorum TaxID=1821260 RepID=UPI0007E19AF2|nr:3'-5' exonuclease KapD [Bacillus marinisedimentorum]
MHQLFIDFEFTMPEAGTKGKRWSPEIIEAGFVSVKDGKIEDTFSSFVRPEENRILTGRCKEFLGISQEQIDTGISFKKLSAIYTYYIAKDRTTVVTWGNMDVPIMRRNFQAAGTPFIRPHRELDLAEAYRKFYGERNNTALRKAIVEYGKAGRGKNHRALDDALTTFEVFRHYEKDRSYLRQKDTATLGDKLDYGKMMQELGFA